jgi:hypothetical protein
MAPKKTPKKKMIIRHFPDEENDESAQKIQGLQSQIDELRDNAVKLEKRVAALEASDD